MTVNLFSYTIVVIVQGVYIGAHKSGVAGITILRKKHGIAAFSIKKGRPRPAPLICGIITIRDAASCLSSGCT